MHVHEGINYQCDQCDYKATKKINLKRHKRVVHEGIKYKCDQCDKFISNLNQHKLSVHVGIKYNCDQCNYKATQKN